MKLFASILLILSLTPLVSAQPYTMYSVSDLRRIAPDMYTATVDVVKRADDTPIPDNGTSFTVWTKGCTHVPGKGGENGIVLNGPRGNYLSFTLGETCKVVNIGLL